MPAEETAAGQLAGRNTNLQVLCLIAGLYFSQGIPMGLAMEAFPVMMRQSGVPLEMIALVPLAALPWILKLIWAPLVDNHWSTRLGHRRTWILLMQITFALSLILTSLVPLNADYAILLIVLLAIGCIASATQDTATDGFAAETLRGASLGHANALQIGGMMAGFMVGGAGTMVASSYLPHTLVMLLLALFPSLTVIAVLFWREGEPHRAHRDGTVPLAKIRNAFRREAIWPLLAVAFLYGGAHAGGMSMTKLFLVDQGWSNADVGIVATISGLAMIFIGCPLGSRLVSRQLWLTIGTGIVVAAISLGFWSILAMGIWKISWLTVTIGSILLAVGSGIIAVGASTLAMKFGGSGVQAGTDITVLQSANVLGEMFIAGIVVWSASITGYGLTFLLSTIGVLAILLVLRWASKTTPATFLDKAAD